MDEVTRNMLFKLAEAYPGGSINMTHQFLDGYEGKVCGFTPNKITEEVITIRGQWWKINNPSHKGEVND